MKMRQQLQKQGRHLRPYQTLIVVSRHKRRMNRKPLNCYLTVRAERTFG